MLMPCHSLVEIKIILSEWKTNVWTSEPSVNLQCVGVGFFTSRWSGLWSIRKEEELSNVLYTDNSWSPSQPANTSNIWSGQTHRLLATPPHLTSPHITIYITYTLVVGLAMVVGLHDIINWR